MKPGDEIYLQSPNFGSGRRHKGVFLCARNTEPPTVKVILREGSEPWIARPEEVELQSVVDEREARAKYVKVIAAWESGLRSSSEIASKIIQTPQAVAGAIRACKNRGFITE